MNTYSEPYRFRLKLGNRGDDRIIVKRELWNNDSACFKEVATFSYPVTKYRRPKIYIIKSEDKIFYVGYTSQSITTRLVDGMKKAGTFPHYKGYKWKDFDEIELFVFVFDKTINKPKLKKDEEFIQFVQTIEAEMVFLIRTKTKEWPLMQNEIHFYNENLKEANQIASQLLKCVL